MSIPFFLVLGAVGAAVGHETGNDRGRFPINPALGVSGFPDCVRRHPLLKLTMAQAGMDLVCAQRPAAKTAIKIGCIGDSITAGVHSTGGNHTYPFQLQIALDREYGWGEYSVTNLGACGSTMLKAADSPYWKRPQYQTLINNTWDIVTIMLGTNDAKDHGSGGPPNWAHDCGGPTHPQLQGCQFATDFMAMIEVVKGLGTTPAGPEIYVVIPPPLMQRGAYGMNWTVINSVFPGLAALIQHENKVHGPVDIFAGMGGVPDWQAQFPHNGCTLNSSWAPCKWWCDAQSCDQCHPNNNGYHQLATAFRAGLTLPPPPPKPPSPPSPSPNGAWVYELGGNGKAFLAMRNFSSNKNNSGRGDVLSWDACGGARFDNGDKIFDPSPGHGVGGVLGSGDVVLVGSTACAKSFNYKPSEASFSTPFKPADGIRYEGFQYLEVHPLADGEAGGGGRGGPGPGT